MFGEMKLIMEKNKMELIELIKEYYNKRNLKWPDFDSAMKFVITELGEVYEIDQFTFPIPGSFIFSFSTLEFAKEFYVDFGLKYCECEIWKAVAELAPIDLKVMGGHPKNFAEFWIRVNANC
jgi:hypothetical protein